MPLRINNGFDRLSDAELETTGQAILTAMTGNTNFPTPVPSLAQLGTALTDYVQSLAIAINGSNLEKAIKNDKRETLIENLHLLSNYVLFTAAGDRTIAQSAGMPMGKGPTPAPPLTKPENLRLSEGGNSGELRLLFDRVPGARSYLYQITPDPVSESSSWQSYTGTTRQYVFTGLVTGQKYWARVVAVGSGAQAISSEAVCRIVL